MPKATTKDASAAPGDRTVKFAVSLWANKLTGASENGTICLRTNASHGIRRAVQHFDSLDEIPAALKQLLDRAKVKVHPSGRPKGHAKKPSA